MVLFGKKLKSNRYEPWETEYLDYDRLKSIIKSIRQRIDNSDYLNNSGTISNYEFRMALHEEIEKVVLFFLETQGDIAKRMKLLRSKQLKTMEQVKEQHYKNLHVLGENNDCFACEKSTASNEWAAVSLSELELLATQYRRLGETLVELVHFVELNATGVRKILKKHDKKLCKVKHYYERTPKTPRTHKKDASSLSGFNMAHIAEAATTDGGHSKVATNTSHQSNNVHVVPTDIQRLSKQYWTMAYHGTTDSHLQQLYHYDGITALVTTLRNALLECIVLQWALQEHYPTAHQAHGKTSSPSKVQDTPMTNNIRKRYDSIQHYLTKKTSSMSNSSLSGDENLGENLNINKAALMGLVAHSLSLVPLSPVNGFEDERHWKNQDFLLEGETYDDAREQIIWWIEEKEPVLEQLESARRKLHKSTNFLEAVAGHSELMLPPDEDEEFEEDTVTTDSDDGETAKKQRRSKLRHVHRPKTKKASQLSSFLNLMSTFLYMTNYYIIAPTSGAYATKLGASRSLSGLIIGMTPIAACVSAVLYSWWANHSYKSALLFASTCSVLGNIFYALGLPFNNFAFVIVGRILNGFGGARAINRRYIADNFHKHERTAASAAFVTAGALGMSAGPAMAATLGYLLADDQVVTAAHYKTRGLSNLNGRALESASLWNSFTAETSPGWVMGTLWTIYLISTFFFFEEPQKVAFVGKSSSSSKKEKKHTCTRYVEQGNGEAQPLTSATKNAEQDKSEKKQKKGEKKKANSLWCNIPVMTTLAIYFVLKFVLEAQLSSSEPITNDYFGWDFGQTGTFLAVLGLLMFPANLLVAHLCQTYEDRDIIVSSLLVMTVGCLGLLHFENVPWHHRYTAIQYVIFGMSIFLSCNVLESVNMSLLSKTIPTSWAKGTFNSGLLATEAGTLGRAAGDMFITAVAEILGFDLLLDGLFVPCAVVSALMAVITIHLYPYLEPTDDDDEDDD